MHLAFSTSGEGISAFLVVVSIAVVALIAKVFPPTTQGKRNL